MRNRRQAGCRIFVLFTLICSLSCPTIAQSRTAILEVKAGKVENFLSPTLYGQFAEFMYEGIKGGLSAELIRDRGFDEQPNALGLPRYWERDPDDRNDDSTRHFLWDDHVFLPANSDSNTLSSQRSLRVEIRGNGGQRHGIHQESSPIQGGMEYRGYVWLKSADYIGDVTVMLEAEQTGGEHYASAMLTPVMGDWKQYSFQLRPSKPDPWRNFPFSFRDTAGCGSTKFH